MIYVLEDDESIRELIIYTLNGQKMEAKGFSTPSEFWEAISEKVPSLVLLDIMLPKIDGFGVCAQIRRQSQVPILMLTALDGETQQLRGFGLNIDDYVTKPFSPAELTARVDALFRRAGGEEIPQTGEIRQDPFLLNTRNRTLEKNGQRIKLTQVEYSIMKVFMENPGKALSREEILDMVWGRDYFGELKIVDVNIRRLRLKIEDNVQNPTYITTVWGYGYKWGF